MKICDNCGAINSDDRFFCVDCNEKLGNKLSDVQEEKENARLKAKREEFYNKNEPLHISLYDKIAGVSCLVCGVVLIVCLAIFLYRGEKTGYLWVGFVIAISGALEAFCPQAMWALEEMRLSFTVAESDLTPSSFYMFTKKISEVFCCICCIAIIIPSVISISRPQVVKYAKEMYYHKKAQAAFEEIDVEELIEENPKTWKIIINGGDYTVKEYRTYLIENQDMGILQRFMIEAMLEIENLDVSSDDYISVLQFIADFDNRTELNKKN